MGAEHSQDHYDSVALTYYNQATTCVLPDVGIDVSMLKFSGLHSNAALQAYSDELVTKVPIYVSGLGIQLAKRSFIPNAVGLGALVVSMLIELVIGAAFSRPTEDVSTMLQRVFGEEKASAVRDTMDEYLKRHYMYISDDQRVLQQITTVERQLSDSLTRLKNSLLTGQMSTRGFKIWVNGAAFHIQMLIHSERLSIQNADYVSKLGIIRVAIKGYVLNLDRLLEKYKTYKISTTSFTSRSRNCNLMCERDRCTFGDTEAQCYLEYADIGRCSDPPVTPAYVNHIFTKYEPITGLKKYFTDTENNLEHLINQHHPFTFPTTEN